MKPLPMYVAVKALIFEGDRLLLLKKTVEGFWDIPGGRINPGEHIITALKRELAEELPDFKEYSIKEMVGVRKKETPLDDGNELFLLYFLVESSSSVNGLTLSSEHSAYKYFSQEEVSQLEEPYRSVYGELMKRVLEKKQSELSEKSVVV